MAVKRKKQGGKHRPPQIEAAGRPLARRTARRVGATRGPIQDLEAAPPKRLLITDVVLRDAHQSLLATRMRTEDMLPIAHKLNAVG